MDAGQFVVKIFRNFDQIDFLAIAVVFLAGLVVIRFVELLFPWIDSRMPGRFRLNLSPSVPVLRLIITISMIAMIVPLVMKPTFENLVVFMGASGVAVGFALKELINSIIAGIVATYERPYRLGDWVEIDGVYGEVKSMGLRAVHIVTPDDTLAIIPHNKIWNTGIHNASAGKLDLQCVVDFYLDPAHDPFIARERLYDVALSSSFTNLARPIQVLMSEKPWYSHYTIKAYPIDSRDQFNYITEMTMRGKAVLAQERIQPAGPFSRLKEPNKNTGPIHQAGGELKTE